MDQVLTSEEEWENVLIGLTPFSLQNARYLTVVGRKPFPNIICVHDLF